MKTAALFIVLYSVNTFANTPVIVESINDQKATVYVPVNVSLKPGDMLYTTQPTVIQKETSVVQTAAKVPENTQSHEKELRKREHNLSVKYGSSEIKVKYNGVSKKSKSSSLISSYYYNWGYAEGGVELVSSIDENSTLKINANQTIFAVRGNAVKNEPGNNWIPFAGFGIGYYYQKNRDKSGTSNQYNGKIWALAIGLSWYPLGELVAIEGMFYQLRGSLDYSGDPIIGTNNIDAEEDGFRLAYTISF